MRLDPLYYSLNVRLCTAWPYRSKESVIYDVTLLCYNAAWWVTFLAVHARSAVFDQLMSSVSWPLSHTSKRETSTLNRSTSTPPPPPVWVINRAKWSRKTWSVVYMVSVVRGGLHLLQSPPRSTVKYHMSSWSELLRKHIPFSSEWSADLHNLWSRWTFFFVLWNTIDLEYSGFPTSWVTMLDERCITSFYFN